MSDGLQLDDLTVGFAGAVAVEGLSLQVAPGRTLGIVGESGSGKSITLRAIMGILPNAARVESGRLQLGDDELPLVGRRVRSSRRTRMSMVFQDPLASLNPLMRVGDLIAEVPRRTLGRSRAQSRDIALDLMRRVRLPDPERLARAYPHELSGGQRQRIMIAAALACEPEVLLCDEPTTALDVTVQAAVLDLLNEITERSALATIFVSHDLAVISQVADDVLVLQGGHTQEAGTADAVLSAPSAEYTRTLLSSIVTLPRHVHVESTRPTLAKTLPHEGRTEPARLEVLGARVTYRNADRPALDGVDLRLSARQIHGLVGESGSGKTTLARVVTGQLPTGSGSVLLDGAALTPRRSKHELRAIQMVFQDPYLSLDPRMSVRQTLAELVRLVRPGGRSAVEARCRELVDMVALPSSALDRVPGQFSGGQRQRIAIARALAVEPRVLVADEPTSALDVTVQAAILTLLAQLRDDLGLSVLLISHDLGVVHEICDAVSVIDQGRIVESGATRALFAAPSHPYTRLLLDSVPRVRQEST